MKIVLQRVSKASVSVEDKITGKIENGYLALLGISDNDDKEKAEKARPEIKTTVDNLDEYDTIYIGYPIWWGTMPMAMFTFIENNNLDGKTIIPFSTHKGSGLGSSVSDLKTALHNSTIKDGLACNSSTTTAQIKNWIENSEK